MKEETINRIAEFMQIYRRVPQEDAERGPIRFEGGHFECTCASGRLDSRRRYTTLRFTPVDEPSFTMVVSPDDAFYQRFMDTYGHTFTFYNQFNTGDRMVWTKEPEWNEIEDFWRPYVRLIQPPEARRFEHVNTRLNIEAWLPGTTFSVRSVRPGNYRAAYFTQTQNLPHDVLDKMHFARAEWTEDMFYEMMLRQFGLELDRNHNNRVVEPWTGARETQERPRIWDPARNNATITGTTNWRVRMR